MPRRCSICANEKLNEINSALVKNQPYRQVALRFALSEWATYRHRRDHLPLSLAKSREAVEIAEGDSLVEQLRQLLRETYGILAKAKAANDLRTSLFAVREARASIELLGRISSEIAPEQTVNLKLSPEWVSLQATILKALEPFPSARAALAEALNDRR